MAVMRVTEQYWNNTLFVKSPLYELHHHFFHLTKCRPRTKKSNIPEPLTGSGCCFITVFNSLSDCHPAIQHINN